MPLAADGHRADELLNLENAIAASSIWRAIVADWDVDWATLKAAADAGAGTEQDARDAVIWERSEVDLSSSQGTDQAAITPHCKIRHMDGEISREALDQWDIDGMLSLEFELPIPATYQSSVRDALTNFLNILSRLETELATGIIDNPATMLQAQKLQIGRMGQLDPEELNGQQVRAVEYFVGYRGTLL